MGKITVAVTPIAGYNRGYQKCNRKPVTTNDITHPEGENQFHANFAVLRIRDIEMADTAFVRWSTMLRMENTNP